MSARARLLSIQKELTERVRQEIEDSLGPPSPDLEQSLARYRAGTRHYECVVELEAIIESIAASDLVYFGDYHTLREAQKTPVRILEEFLVAHPRPLVIATEVVHLEHQALLDAYLADEIPESEFLRRIRYRERWGFPWRNHRLPFDLARRHGFPMVAVNTDPLVLRDNFTHRDRLAAMRIVELLEEEPDRLVVVLFGDLHVVSDHLPGQVDGFLRTRGRRDPVRRTIVFQNCEAIFWQLAEHGLPRRAVQVRDREFAVFTSTPLVRLQSYLHWELQQSELEETAPLDATEWISAQVLTDQVLEILETIVRFFRLPAVPLDRFRVATPHDLNLLTELEDDPAVSEAELADLERHLSRGESYYLPRRRLIYLSNLSVDHASEEACHYLHGEVIPPTPPGSPRDAYYVRVMREAVAFLGSKIVNPHRPCFGPPEFEAALGELRGRRLAPEDRALRCIFRDVLMHLRAETRGRPRFRKPYLRPAEVVVGATHSLGYWLGERVHRALLEDRLTRAEARQLFVAPLDPEGRAEELYLTWSRRLGPEA